MLYLAEAGDVTISIPTLVTICGILMASVFLAIKIITKVSPAADQFFSRKKTPEMDRSSVHDFLSQTEHRPLYVKMVTHEVPEGIVLRLSTNEANIARLEGIQLEAAKESRQQYNNILDGLGAIREAMASKGFPVRPFEHR